MDKIINKKVLIIGETFHQNSGGGITLSNLFSDWPKENLAVISTHKTIIKSKTDICDNLYQLGTEEIKPLFPLNLLQKKYKSGPFEFSQVANHNDIFSNSNTSIKYIVTLVDKFFSNSGLYFLLSRIKPSKKLYNWINDFKPDIIYSQLSTLELIRFVHKIQKETNIPLAIHIMDDWPEYLPDKCFAFKKYWKEIIDKEFKLLLNDTKHFFSISESMSKEYEKRYEKKFVPFHNPVDLDQWVTFSKQAWKNHDPFKVLYTGRIGIANSNSIYAICKAIKYLSQKSGINIVLQIYTPNFNDDNAKKIKQQYPMVEISQPVPHSKMPELLSSVDLLILPLDFDKKSVRFARLSMPTKASEYMISGTPIIVFADKETHLAKHASKYGWASVITRNDYIELANKIRGLINDYDAKIILGEKAKSFSVTNYNKEIITEKFRNCLM